MAEGELEVVEGIDIKAGGSKQSSGAVSGASGQGEEGGVRNNRAWGGVAKEQVQINSRTAKEGDCVDKLGVA